MKGCFKDLSAAQIDIMTQKLPIKYSSWVSFASFLFHYLRQVLLRRAIMLGIHVSGKIGAKLDLLLLPFLRSGYAIVQVCLYALLLICEMLCVFLFK